MTFAQDPDLKYIVLGLLAGVFVFYTGQVWLFLIVVLGFLYLYGSWKRYDLALCILPFFVILDYIVKSSAVPFGGFWDEILWLVLFVLLMIHQARKPAFSFKTSSIIYPIGTFLIIGFLSLAFSMDITLGQGIEGIRSVLQTFLFYLLFLNAPISKKSNRALLVLVLVAGAVTAIFGLYQYVIGVPNPPHWLDKDLEAGLSRAFSFLGSPNAFAAYGVLLIPLALGFMFRKGYTWLQRGVFFVFFVLLSAGVFSSLTRAAWVALLPALVLFGVLIKKTKWMLSLIILLLIAASFVAPIRTRFTNLFSEQYQQKSEMGGRNYRWNLAWSIFEENPLLGRGPGSYGGAVAYRAQAFSGLYVDNYYLQVLSNYGFLGFLAFLWILIEIFRQLILAAKLALEKDKVIVYGVISGFVAFLVHNITENLWEVIPLSVIVWVMIGLAKNLSFAERD